MATLSKPLLADYIGNVAREMQAKSLAIRRHFASHHPSAGDNREDLVESFLRSHLPTKFGVGTGLVISTDNVFSNQSDLLIVDQHNNTPLYAGTRNKLWPVEAVFALVEVKTRLGPDDIADGIAKARRFKALRRVFCDAGNEQRITDSLFVLWSFEAPAAETFKKNLNAALAGVARGEQPDLVVVPDRFVAKAGTYLELSKLGHPTNLYRKKLHAQSGPNLSHLVPDPAEVTEHGEDGEDALLAGYTWLDSWLRQAGSRLVDPAAYLSAYAGPSRVV